MQGSNLKIKLRNGETLIGSLVSVAEPFIAEVMGAADFDFLIVDTEHCPMSIHQLQTILIALSPTASTIIVRARSGDATDIKQILDIGADGILVPSIADSAQTEAVVAAAKYPPEGIRGFGPRRAARLVGGARTYSRIANDEVIVMIMIEQREAVDNLEEILATPGLDAIMVGPSDLAASMGYLNDMENSAVSDAIERVLTECKIHAVPFGIFSGNAKSAGHWISRGGQLATIGGDIPFMDAGIAQARQDIARILNRSGS
ncbi:MAG TPA: aldolase/citrate lyase family protein [Acidimicrobiales bacterium]|jgi:2-keto-3-deoxy-L-rhamnonate aldolase RhmA|nr:aldolase/citrate lyase family protein [Acidimicrobiales bacterium]